MGLNFLGLGFSLGAQDKGLAGAIKETSSGLMDISKSVIGIGLASAKMVFTPPNLKPAIGMAQTLANDVKLNTTAIEAYGVAASKTTSAGLAGLNLTEKQLRRAQSTISSTAFALNVPVENVTKSFAALTQAGIDTNKMADYGFDSFSDFQKVMEVTGTNSDEFAASLGTMNKQLGMTKGQIKNSVQAVAAIGKSMNIGRQAISGMSETVKILNANANLLPQQWSPARMDKFLKGTTIVAGALTSIGMTADEAMGASRGLTQALLKGQKNMSDTFAGLKDDLGNEMDVLTQNFGSADEAFKMLQESPDQFMLKIGKVVDQVNKKVTDPQALNRFRSQMEATFGPQVMAAFQKKGYGQLAPMIEKANKMADDGGKALKSLAQAHQDGRTYAERFGWAQDMIQTKLKQVKGVMSDDKYLKEYVKQGKQFTDWAAKTAAKGGPLGKMTDMLIEVKNRGFGGFLAAHSKFGFAMSETIKMLQPTLQYLPALSVAFRALMNPMGLVIAAVAGLYFAFKDLNKGANSVLRPMIDKMVKEAPVFLKKVWGFIQEVGRTIFKVIQSIDWDKVVDVIMEGLSAIFDFVANIDWGGIAQTLMDALGKVVDFAFKVIDRIDWNKVGQVLGVILSKAVDVALALVGAVFNLAERIGEWLAGIDWKGVITRIGDALVMIFDKAADFLGKINWGKVGTILGDILIKAMEVALLLLQKAFALGERIVRWLGDIDWTAVGQKLGYYLAAAADLALQAVALVFQKIWQIFTHIPEIMAKAWQMAVDFVVGLLDGIRDYLVNKFPSATKPIVFIFEMIKAAVKIVGGAFKLAWEAIGAVLGFIWDIVKGIAKVVGFVLNAAWQVTKATIGFIWDILKGIYNVISTIVHAVGDALGWAFGKIKDAVGWIYDKLSAVGGVIGSVVSGIGGALSKVGGFFSGIGGSIKSLFSSSEKSSGVSMQQLINKQMEANKKIIEEYHKRNIELAKKGDERAMKEEGYVKTIEGNIIKSIDSLTQYTRDASGKIKETYVTAAAYSKGFVQGEAWEELEKMQEGIRKEGDALRGKNYKMGSKEQEKWMQDMDTMLAGFDKQHEEYMKKFGVRWDIMYQANEQIKGQFAIETKLLDDAKAKSEGYYTTLTGLQKSLSKESGELRLEMLKLEAQGKVGTEHYMDIQKKYLDSMADGKAKLDQYTTILAGNMHDALDKFAKDSNEYAQKAQVAAHIIAEGYKNSVTSMLAGLPEQSKATSDLVTSMMTELGNAQEKAVADFLKTTKLTGPALDAAVADITKKYKDQQDQVTSILKQNHEALMVGAQNDTLAALDKVKQGYAGMVKEVNAKTSEAAGEIQKQFGVSADAALESVNQIAAIDPNTFKKNMAVVKRTFMDFLAEMDAKGKKLLDNTTKSFNQLWETMNNGWKKHTELLTTYTDKTDQTLTKFWDMVTTKANNAVDQLMATTGSLSASFMALAKTINIMDLLASPDQITQWAAAVVSALAYAFRNGGAADAMISASYNKALQMASEIQTSAGAPATPDTSKTSASPSSSSITAAQELLRVMDYPKWATDPKAAIPSELDEMNHNLKVMIELLGKMAGSKATKPTSTPPKISH